MSNIATFTAFMLLHALAQSGCSFDGALLADELSPVILQVMIDMISP